MPEGTEVVPGFRLFGYLRFGQITE